MTRVRPLRWHLVWAALAGAAVVAAVTALLALPLVRSVATNQARGDLARAVETLASAPMATARQLVRERKAVGPDDRQYAVVLPSGETFGGAASIPTAQDVATLQRTGTLSVTVNHDGVDILVEGRALKGRGLDVIGVQPVNGVRQATGTLVRRILAALGIGLAIAVVLGLLIARRVTGPVARAAERAHRLARGERGLEQETSAISEVQEMVQALGALDSALATSEARQREFLLSISHELRTPLTALRGYAEALRDGAVPPEDVPAVGATLAGESDRLGRFIDDLLALARLEADDFPIEATDIDLQEVATRAIAPWQAMAAAAGVSLSTAPGEALVVRGDPVRIEQIIAGLLENALRVTPSGGSVVVAATRLDPDTAQLSVTDTGPGLDPGEHEHAFERGYLRDRYAGARSVGSGLGLSIAHRVCKRMGGTLEAGPSEDGGTEIRMTLASGA
ncbi:MAG: ATPase/histidine kinase/DNA gyrase domain protein [Marmoricola sp.]|nr:ATPase/histidine kinase/DNA gyrase domain protein [Marmoricola sp.]